MRKFSFLVEPISSSQYSYRLLSTGLTLFPLGYSRISSIERGIFCCKEGKKKKSNFFLTCQLPVVKYTIIYLTNLLKKKWKCNHPFSIFVKPAFFWSLATNGLLRPAGTEHDYSFWVIWIQVQYSLCSWETWDKLADLATNAKLCPTFVCQQRDGSAQSVLTAYISWKQLPFCECAH